MRLAFVFAGSKAERACLSSQTVALGRFARANDRLGFQELAERDFAPFASVAGLFVSAKRRRKIHFGII
jgi:hypothetical protein